MTEDWTVAHPHLLNISVSSNPNNEPVSIHGQSQHLKCIGIGTDAAVFQSVDAPAYVFKVYAADKLAKIQTEWQVYQLLGDSPYFSTCFGFSDHYLVLNYEKGMNLFDCLIQGISIPKQVIEDVDQAREYVRQKGLNPRDIHLKNILLQNGRAKIIDVSEYVQQGNDLRWEHLKQAYYQYYHFVKGKPIPFRLIEMIRKRYHQISNHSTVFEEFMESTCKLMNVFLK